MALSQKTQQKITNHIQNRTPFKHGNVSGVPGGAWRWGRLPVELRDSVKQADYVVYSYSTPIAWHDGSWHVPDEHYSPSTTHHQNVIRRATNNKPNQP